MNEDMKAAWLEITQMMGETTKEELDVFLRTWQRAVQAERERFANECIDLVAFYGGPVDLEAAIRARGSNT